MPPQQRKALSVEGWQAVLSPDGHRLAQRSAHGNVVRIWNLEGQRAVLEALCEHKSITDFYRFAPDGRTLVTAGRDGNVRLWRLENGKAVPLAVLKGGKSSDPVLAFSPDGKTLATVADPKTVKLWDLTGTPVREKAVFEVRSPSAWASPTTLAFTPDSKTLVSANMGGGLQLWDVSGSAPRFLSVAGVDTWPVRALAVTPDGKTLFSAQQRLLRVWDRVGNELRERVIPHGHTDAVTALDFSPDCRTLASSGSDNRVVLWDLTAAVPAARHVLRGDGRVRFAPDGRSLVTGFKDLLLWDLNGKAPRLSARLGSFRSGPAALAFSPHGKLFASGSVTPVLRLWDLDGQTPQMRTELFEKPSGAGVEDLALSPDGQLLAGGRQWSGNLRLWRIQAAGVEEAAVPRTKAFRIAFSPDGKTFAFSDDSQAIHLWDLTSPVPSERLALKGHQVGIMPVVRDFVFSADGRLLASAGGDGRIMVWETTKGKKLHEWKLPAAAGAVAFAADGRHLAVGNANGTIYVLRLASR
jgi:WD40 repeat protein